MSNNLCPICNYPKNGGSGRLTQWIVSCQCARVERIDETEIDPVTICRNCGKRIGSGRAGSFTQYIFRYDTCDCQAPDAVKIALSAVTAQESSVDNTVPGIELETSLDEITDSFPADRYQPVAQLGAGAFSSVYLARDKLLNKEVAVKVLHTCAPRQLVAFQAEARATSMLKHDSIVSLIDFGVGIGGAPYMVLEYLQGTAMDEVIEKEGPFDWQKCLLIFSQICSGLQYAHLQGVFHRDVKPSNIIIMERSSEVRACLIDFGIAQLQSSINPTPSAINIVGAPLYISPDEGLGRSFDARSEVYSLGCVLFEALTGHPPYLGATPLETLQMHAASPPPRLSRYLDESKINSALQAVIDKALSKDPASRFQTMAEFRCALQEITPHRQTTIFALPVKNHNNRKFQILLVALIALAAFLGLSALGYLHTDRGSSGRPALIDSRTRLEDELDQKQIEQVENQFHVTEPKKWERESKEVFGYGVDDEDFKLLADYPPINSLTLTLESRATGTGVQYLKKHPLTTFATNSREFNDQGAYSISQFKSIQRLCILHTNKLTDKGLSYLVALPQLNTLQLRFINPLPDDALRVIARSKSLSRLDLGHSSPVTCRNMRDLTGMPKLSEIVLAHTDTDDDCLRELSKMKLLTLEMGSTKITDGGLITLSKISTLSELTLNFSDRGLTLGGVEKFKRLRPNCNVVVKESYESIIETIVK